MSKYTVVKGGHYKASFALSGFEVLADNNDIRQKLEDAGFSRVEVWGEGGARYAEGHWEKDDATADLPSQLHEIIKKN